MCMTAWGRPLLKLVSEASKRGGTPFKRPLPRQREFCRVAKEHETQVLEKPRNETHTHTHTHTHTTHNTQVTMVHTESQML